MEIIHIDPFLIEEGREAFNHYMSCTAVTGVRAVPGVIVSCLEHAMQDEAQIVELTSRISKCRDSTVQTVLMALSGDDPSYHLWRRAANDQLELLPEGIAETEQGSFSVIAN